MNTRIAPLAIATLVLALGLSSGTAQAALQGRDLNGSIGSFEAYYDTDRNITWLSDANVNGQMIWDDANIWAANLSFTDGINVYDNWRLPTALNQDGTGLCSGYDCTGSEMGHLFYNVLGGTAGQSILTSQDPDLAKFTNLQADIYWTGTDYGPDSVHAVYFAFGGGYPSSYDKVTGFFALAVSPGDVGAVPEAESWAMLLAGLALVGVATRRRRV